MKVVKVLSLLLVVAGLLACSSKPMPEALESLKQAQQQDDYYLFVSENPVTDTCYIYYPGGLVYAEAYAPYVAAVAEQGANAFLLRLNFDMAMLDADAADNAKQSEFAQQHCKKYVLGGHSLGGLAIAMYGETHPEDGLLFISSYPHKDGLVDKHPAPMMVVYASNDLLATEQDVNDAKAYMPETTEYFKIEGGNHAQMGFYGPQNRDGEATISREQQQQILVEKTMVLIQQMTAE